MPSDRPATGLAGSQRLVIWVAIACIVGLAAATVVVAVLVL